MNAKALKSWIKDRKATYTGAMTVLYNDVNITQMFAEKVVKESIVYLTM